MDRGIIEKYVLMIIFIAAWFICFPIDYQFNPGVLINGLYFAGAFIGYFVVSRLNIKSLKIGWELSLVGFLTAFLAYITRTPAWVRVFFGGVIPAAGVIFISSGVYQLVSKYRQGQREMRIQQLYFEQLFQNSTNGIVMLDNGDRVIQSNVSFNRIFGYQSEEIKGLNINQLIVPEDRIERAGELSRDSHNKKTVVTEGIRRKKNGEEIYVSITGCPIIIDGKTVGIYGIYNDITEDKKKEDKIRYLSYHDELTGLYNRRYLKDEITRLKQAGKFPITIIMTDLDGLKETNDSLGHLQGDKLIKTAAGILKSINRKEDVVVRMGGDEFVTILPETGSAAAESYCQRLNKKCRIKNRKARMKISFSTGYAVMNTKDEDLAAVLGKADRNMYQNKALKKEQKKLKDVVC